MSEIPEDLNRTIYPPRTADASLKWFIEAVKKLAFEMPPANNYTSRFVMLCIMAENEMHDRMAAEHNAKRARMRQRLDIYTQIEPPSVHEE